MKASQLQHDWLWGWAVLQSGSSCVVLGGSSTRDLYLLEVSSTLPLSCKNQLPQFCQMSPKVQNPPHPIIPGSL